MRYRAGHGCVALDVEAMNGADLDSLLEWHDAVSTGWPRIIPTASGPWVELSTGRQSIDKTQWVTYRAGTFHVWPRSDFARSFEPVED